MRFGIFYEHQLPRPWGPDAEHRLLAEALEQVELADACGIDYVWEVEHHFLEEYSHSSAPEVFLAAASQRTRQIRLGHGIVQAPAGVNHPARIAERVATLDLVSGGRVEFGTGESSSAAELGGFGVPREAKRAMWAETLDAVTRMFTEDPFAGYDGDFLRMPPRNVLPKPLQKPHPPLWVACSRRETIHLAARSGVGALSFSFAEPEEAAHWVTEYYDLIASGECVPRGFAVNPNVAVVLPMMLHPDEATAIDRGIDGAHFFGYSLGHYYGGTHLVGGTDLWQSFGENRAKQGFAREIVSATAAPLAVRLLQAGLGSLRGAIGTPAQVTDLIARYEAAGVDQVMFVMQAGQEPARAHLREHRAFRARGAAAVRRRPGSQRGREGRPAVRRRGQGPRPPQRAAHAGRALPDRRGRRACRRAPVQARAAARPGRPGQALGRRVGQAAGAGRARALARRASDRGIERALGNAAAQRALFTVMASGFDAAKAAGFTGRIVYVLSMSDGSRRSWTIEVLGKRATARQGGDPAAALTIRVPLADFVRVIADAGSFLPLVLDGRMTMDGDLGLANRLADMFGGRSTF